MQFSQGNINLFSIGGVVTFAATMFIGWGAITSKQEMISQDLIELRKEIEGNRTGADIERLTHTFDKHFESLIDVLREVECRMQAAK